MARLVGLDILRGIAAFAVAFQHAVFLSGADPLIAHSYLAVDFFFLLSGFIIARNFEHRMPPATTFLFMRVRRLWPLIAIGILIGAAFAASKGVDMHTLLTGVITGLFFLPLANGEVMLNIPAWSILFELAANFIHALILSRLSTRKMVVVAVIAALAFIMLGSNGGGHGDRFWHGIPRVMLSYCAGILLFRTLGDQPRLPQWSAIVGLPLAIGLASWFKMTEFDIFLIIAVFPVILIGGLHSNGGTAGQIFGAISFPLYALHWPVLLFALSAGSGLIAAFAIAAAASLTIGILIDRQLRELLFRPDRAVGMRRYST